MRLYKFFSGAMVFLTIFLASPAAAQQNGSLLPPPLKRNQAKMASPLITAFDDWVHRCTDIDIEEKTITQCELLQAQQRSQGDEMLNILILAFAEIAPEADAAKAEFMLTSVVPLDVFLPDGLRLLVDSRAVLHIPFRNCNINGCWSQMIVEEKALNAFKRGYEGLARFTMMNGQEAEVKFSLKGLIAGLDALQQSLKPKN